MSHGFKNLPIVVEGGAVGPGTTTNNSIPTWNGTDGTQLNDNPGLSFSSDVLSTPEIDTLLLSGPPNASGPAADTVIKGVDTSDGVDAGGNLALKPGIDASVSFVGDGRVVLYAADGSGGYIPVGAVDAFGIQVTNGKAVLFQSGTDYNATPTMALVPSLNGTHSAIDINGSANTTFPTLRIDNNGQVLLAKNNPGGTSFIANLGWAIPGVGDIGVPHPPRYLYTLNTVTIGGGAPAGVIDADCNLVITPGGASRAHILFPSGSGCNIGAGSALSGSDYRPTNIFAKGTLVVGSAPLGISPPYGLNQPLVSGIIFAANDGSAAAAFMGASTVFNATEQAFIGFAKDLGFANAPAFNNANDVADNDVYLSVMHLSAPKTDLVKFDGDNGTISTLTGSGKVLAAGGIGIGNSESATVTVGSLANKMEVFDASGNSLGFVPIYSSIT